MEPYDPSRMRISDAERHKVAEVLREAAAEGRIDFDELSFDRDGVIVEVSPGHFVLRKEDAS